MAKPSNDPWLPAPYDDHITGCIKALAVGKASEGQQIAALDWIIRIVCGAYDQGSRVGADGDRKTAFAEGRITVNTDLLQLDPMVMTMVFEELGPEMKA